MIKEKLFRRLALVLALMLVVPFVAAPVSNVSYAASSASTIKPIYITAKSYVKLETADLIPSSNGNTLSYTVTFHNNDSKTIQLIDYWTNLTSTSGVKYSIKLIDSDKTKKEVVAGGTATLTFYAEVPASISISSLIIKLIKFDFSVSGYEKTLGKFTFGTGYSNDINTNGYKAAKISNTTVNMRVNKAYLSTGVEDNDIEIELVMRNTGKYNMTLTNYKFYLQTAAGALYQLDIDTDHTESIILKSNILETVDLSLELPATIKTAGAKLVVVQSVGETTSAVNIPVGAFKLGFTASNLSTNQYLYKNGSYSYQLSVASINKLPGSTNNNIIAKVTVKNTGTAAAPIPDVTGALYIDKTSEITTKVIPLTTQVSIPANSSVDVYYYGALPNSYTYSSLQFKLYEVDGETKRELAALATTTPVAPKSISSGNSYEVNSGSDKATATVVNTRMYEGDYGNMFAVFMDISNTNTRAKLTDKWTGYIELPDGSLYEAKIVKTTKSINPSQKEQIILTAEVPKSVDVTGATLLLGLGFNDTGLVNNDDAVTGYIHAARFQLPVKDAATDDFSAIKVGPFGIDITYLNAYVKSNTLLNLAVGSTVTRDLVYDGFSSNKITISLEDETTNNVMYEKVIELDGSTSDTIWKTGSNYTELTQDMTNKRVPSAFTLNVYEELNGYKFKLVSKEIEWSIGTNWAE